jgi:prepilin signal peptidase PulO-like enzyme (type II secretory pathway)
MNPAEAVPLIASAAYLVLVALFVGSFVNLAADRLPRGESIVKPRSHCRGCGRVLNVVDLIPILGYVLRGGRCASCGAPIGVFSPVVEALCGAVTLAALARFGLPWGAAVGGAAVALLGLAVIGLSVARAGVSRPGSRLG